MKEILKEIDSIAASRGLQSSEIEIIIVEELSKWINKKDTESHEEFIKRAILYTKDFKINEVSKIKTDILSNISLLLKNKTLENLRSRKGSVIDATFLNHKAGKYIFKVKHYIGFIEEEDLIPNEIFIIGETYKALIKDIKDTNLTLERSSALFLKSLLNLYFPELKILKLVRKAGIRSLVKVKDSSFSKYLTKEKSIRIIVSEIRGEKIDFFRENEDISSFLKRCWKVNNSIDIKGGLCILTLDDPKSLEKVMDRCTNPKIKRNSSFITNRELLLEAFGITKIEIVIKNEKDSNIH